MLERRSKHRTFLSIVQRYLGYWVILPGLICITSYSLWEGWMTINRFRASAHRIIQIAHDRFQMNFHQADQALNQITASTLSDHSTNSAIDIPSHQDTFLRIDRFQENGLVQHVYTTSTAPKISPDPKGFNRVALIPESNNTNWLVLKSLHPSQDSGLMAVINPDKLKHGFQDLIRDGYRITLVNPQGEFVHFGSKQKREKIDLKELISPSDSGVGFKGHWLIYRYSQNLSKTKLQIIISAKTISVLRPWLITVTVLYLVFLLLSLFVLVRFRQALQNHLIDPLKRFIDEIQDAAGGDYQTRLAPDQTFFELAQVEKEFERMAQAMRSREEMYRSIFENASEGIYQTTLDGRFISVNPSMVELLGCNSTEEVFRNYKDLKYDLHQNPATRDMLMEKINNNENINGFETQMKNRFGEVIQVSLNMHGVRDDQGEIAYLEGTVTDISHRKESESELIRHRNHLEDMVQNRTNELTRMINQLQRRQKEADLITDMGDLLQACDTEEESFSIVSSVCSRMFPEYSGYIAMLTADTRMMEAVAGFGNYDWLHISFDSNDCWALRRGGSHRVTNTRIEPVCRHFKSQHGSSLCVPIIARSEFIGMIHLVADFNTQDPNSLKNELELIDIQLQRISEIYALSLANIRLRERLHHQSIVDPLTRLYNRRHMEYTLDREFDRARRNRTSIGLILLDVDHFKRFNDDFGHEVGDKVLKMLGSYLLESSRGIDIACRYGGEELILILPDCSPEDAHRKAEEVREAIGSLTLVHQSESLSITVSAGVSAFPLNGAKVQEVLKKADQALYNAKNAGRNCVITAF